MGVELPSRYQSPKEIGRGGAAVVYVAYDSRARRPVAIKVLHHKYKNHPEVLKRFEREAQLMMSLRHPNLVQLLDFVVGAQGFTYLVMEYVYGWSLRDLLRQPAKLREDMALPVVYQISDALSIAHEKGIIHRDLKPQNVLISTRGLVKLTDFGIAKAVSGMEDLTKTGHFVGTPLYSSPEQIAGDRDIDGRSDVYSLGCLLYEIYTGSPPFTQVKMEELMDAIAYGDFKSLRMACPNLHARICKFHERMMSTARDKRWANMAEVSGEIAKMLHATNSDDVLALFQPLIAQFGPPTTPEPPGPGMDTVAVETPMATLKRGPIAQPARRQPVMSSPGFVVNRGEPVPARSTRGPWGLLVATAVALVTATLLLNKMSKRGPISAPIAAVQPQAPAQPQLSPETEALKKSLQPLMSSGAVVSPPWVPPVMPSPASTSSLPDLSVTDDTSATQGRDVPATQKPDKKIPPPPSLALPAENAAPPAREPYGTVSVYFDTNANISVNGAEARGPSNVFRNVPVYSSRALLKVTIPGVAGTLETTVPMKRKDDVPINLNLTKEYVGTLQISAPENVKVFVDGRIVGEADTRKTFTLQLWRGQHDVQFVLQGYGPRWKKIQVHPGATVIVNESSFTP
jgi:serine/threonine-protein kinase